MKKMEKYCPNLTNWGNVHHVHISQAFFSPILRLQAQQNFRNLEFRREILEFRQNSFHFDGGNLENSLSLDEKS